MNWFGKRADEEVGFVKEVGADEEVGLVNVLIRWLVW